MLAVDGVTPFCCGCVVWLFWPNPPKDDVLFAVLFTPEKMLEFDDGLNPFVCGACSEPMWLLLPPKDDPKLGAALPPNIPPPFCPNIAGGGVAPFCCPANGLFGMLPAEKLKPPPDPAPEPEPDPLACSCVRKEGMLCGCVGAVGVLALLPRWLLGLRAFAILQSVSVLVSPLINALVLNRIRGAGAVMDEREEHVRRVSSGDVGVQSTQRRWKRKAQAIAGQSPSE